MADAEALGRMISLALRSGIPLADISKQLRGISCDRAVGLGPNKVLSMPDAIGQVLELYMAEKDGVQQELPIEGPAAEPAAVRVQPPTRASGEQSQQALDAYDPGDAFLGTCPECSSDLQFAEGCVKCISCGFSECG